MRPGKMLPIPQAIRPTLSPTPHPVVHLKELAGEESSWNTPSMPYLQEMAGNLLKTSSLSVRTKLLHQTGLSLYNTSHGFHEEDIKKKLQQFPGGSVDLQKEDSGIGILTLNNPSKMNAFSGVMMLQLLEKVIELENWTEGKGLIVRGAKNTFSSGSDLNAVKALATPEAHDRGRRDQVRPQGDGHRAELGRRRPPRGAAGRPAGPQGAKRRPLPGRRQGPEPGHGGGGAARLGRGRLSAGGAGLARAVHPGASPSHQSLEKVGVFRQRALFGGGLTDGKGACRNGVGRTCKQRGHC
uniref:ethylmalonyl-CoA decarboxylase isoform X2 n=1 Tax=Nyctereutes procyonoides TaxID=34880 RepID=UPI002444692F|nr:ethylmalonyl-CoA decarboxylase isoform X2 [Nyctereutes procyonoides]